MIKPRISIVIPTYNEADNILSLVIRVRAILAKESHEIVIVDDRSEDGTYALIEEAFRDEANILCLSHQGVRSLGDSILVGVKAASGEVIVGMDADFSHNPVLLPKLIGSLDKYDIAVASRFIKGGGMESKYTLVFSYLFNLMLLLLFRFPILDNTSGYYAIKRETLMRLHPEKIYYGYGEYHLRLIFFCQQAGLTICEVPVWYTKRKHGLSKSNHFKMLVSYLRAVFMMKFKI